MDKRQQKQRQPTWNMAKKVELYSLRMLLVMSWEQGELAGSMRAQAFALRRRLQLVAWRCVQELLQSLGSVLQPGRGGIGLSQNRL